jgi:hypothetical protein
MHFSSVPFGYFSIFAIRPLDAPVNRGYSFPCNAELQTDERIKRMRAYLAPFAIMFSVSAAIAGLYAIAAAQCTAFAARALLSVAR